MEQTDSVSNLIVSTAKSAHQASIVQGKEQLEQVASAHLTSSSTDDSLARLNFAAEQEVGINEQIKCASCHFLAMPKHWDFVAGPPFTLFHPAVTAVRRPQRSRH